MKFLWVSDKFDYKLPTFKRGTPTASVCLALPLGRYFEDDIGNAHIRMNHCKHPYDSTYEYEISMSRI